MVSFFSSHYFYEFVVPCESDPNSDIGKHDVGSLSRTSRQMSHVSRHSQSLTRDVQNKGTLEMDPAEVDVQAT
jgi:hypothetical protein